MNSIKVSVIIPVYNTPENYLRECIESILSQTLQEFELLCIDDVSTDGSLLVLKEYAQKDSRVIVMRQAENGGVARARNRGMTEARGEYLYFLDCDDFIESNALERMYQVAEEKNLDMLSFSSAYFYESEQLRKDFLMNGHYLTFQEKHSQVVLGPALFQQLKEDDRYYNVIWIQFHKASFLREHGLSFCPQTGTCDDALFTFMVMNSAKRVSCLSETLHHYRIRANSGDTKAKTATYVQWMVHWYQKMISWFLEQEFAGQEQGMYREHFAYVRNLLVQIAWGVHQTGAVLLKETLLNMEHLLFCEPLEQLSPDFMDCLDESVNYCFFGAGVVGRRTLALLQRIQAPLPRAICDNNKELHGTEIYGIPVISFEDALTGYDNLHILITNNNYGEEIYVQVLAKADKTKVSRLFMLL